MKLIKGHILIHIVNKVLAIFNRKIKRTLVYDQNVCEYRYYWEKIK